MITGLDFLFKLFSTAFSMLQKASLSHKKHHYCSEGINAEKKVIIIFQKVIMSELTMIIFFRKSIIAAQKASLLPRRH